MSIDENLPNTPVTEAYAKQIGADGYAADASRAVALAKSLTGKNN